MQVDEKKQQDLEAIVKAAQVLMDIIGTYEDTRASAMAFIKVEEALLWAQVMNTRTGYKDEKIIFKKADENIVE